MKLVAYLRVSTEQQAGPDRYGLPRQRHDVEAFAERAEHEVVAWTEDRTPGGLGLEHRDGFRQALAAVEVGDADGVVVPDLSRLARELTVQEALLASVWARGGVVFEAVGGRLVPEDDPDDPMRTAMRQMAGVFAQLNRGVLAKNMRDGRKRKAARLAEEGRRYAWTHAPYGYVRADDGALEVDPTSEARRVAAYVRRMQSTGWSLGRIADRLNDRGVATPSGRGRWWPATVQRVATSAP